MKIKINPYQRRDGTLMAYANNDRKVSVALTDAGMPAPYGKNTTDGQRSLMGLIQLYIKKLPTVFDGELDFTKHSQPNTSLGECGHLFVTDDGTVCGQPVGADGAFIYKDGRLVKLEWLEV